VHSMINMGGKKNLNGRVRVCHAFIYKSNKKSLPACIISYSKVNITTIKRQLNVIGKIINRTCQHVS
jgi:hypothetical protein